MNDLLSSVQSAVVAEHGHPLVSVILLTYNHERYVEAALRSIMAQVFSEPMEVLVAEDYSTDRTRDILIQLQREFPGRFSLLDRGRNLGLSGNLEDAWKRCRGKYIAILEGDDRWSDSQKLTKVAAALESHANWTGCFHAVRITNEMNAAAQTVAPEPFPDHPVGVLELLPKNWVPTYSAVTYRRGVVNSFPPWHRSIACGDRALHILHAEHGPLGFIPEAMTDYRVHSAGMWSGMGDAYRIAHELAMWDALDRHFKGRYSQEVQAARQQYLDALQETLGDLRKIERRYLNLKLDRVASALHWLKQVARKCLGRP